VTAPNLPSFELEALHTLLEQEFEFLTKQDFKSFEELQHKKQDLLNLLVGEIGGDDPEITPEAIQELIQENQELSSSLIECQNLQKRNETLINQKLQTIQEALSSLGFQDMMKNKDTYEHLNKKSK
jgi:flagellar biosynthesis/type III secretory pathway chaperone|tara:strand:+ start:78 stop:455 length:378 start_codon:yes stop_codon:yes gene_type:complete